MGKWLAIAGALLVVLLILLWQSMDSSSATPPTASPTTATLDQPARADVPAPSVKPSADVEPAVAADDKPKKLDHMSDEFFYKFTEHVPYALSKNAVECYNHRTGSLHRNQKLVLAFDVKVRNGDVTIHNVRVKPPDDEDPKQQNNTLNDPALESCFIQKVARSGWHDDSLPDYDWPDELVIRPERGLKKYWKSNVDYVGEEAPKGRIPGDNRK